MRTTSVSGIVVAICLLTSSVFGELADGLGGYWTFDEVSGGILHDFSGNGQDGNLVNFPDSQGSWTSGQIGGALRFGGPNTGQYVSVPNFPMPTTSMTLTAWVWADSIPRWATVAANWNGAWGAFNYSTFGGTPDMCLYTADARVLGGINVDYGVSSTSLSLNQWHFLAFVADARSRTVTFIQDGITSGSFGYAGQLLASSPVLNIGDDPSDSSPGQGNWSGEIDDLAIWTRALSSLELASIYNHGLAGRPLLTLIPEPPVTAVLGLGILIVACARSPHRAASYLKESQHD